MKVCFKNFLQLFTIFFLTSLLSACGGSSSEKIYNINADIANVSFSNEIVTEFSDSIAINVTFDGDGLLVGYSPDTQPVGWLEFRTENLTANSATIHIDLIDADRINIGEYLTKLRLSTGKLTDNDTNLVHHDIDVSLLIWQANVNTELVSFSGTFGDTTLTDQTIEITSENNEWALSSDIDGITFDQATGTGDASVKITADITNISSAQLITGNIIITETTTGDTKLIPLELGLDNQYIYPSQASLAFSSTLNVSNLNQTVKVNTNSAVAINWQANSTATWLTLTKLENDLLNVTIDLNTAPVEALTTADIMISAVDNDNVINATLPISLFQSTEQAVNQVITDITVNNDTMLPAPNMPYFYVGVANELRVYHQYSAELLQTIVVSPDASLLEQFIVHPDGSKLLAKAVETVNNEDGSTSQVTHRYQINLTDYSFTEIAEANIEFEPVRYVQFSGRYFIVTTALEFADDNLQLLFRDPDLTSLASSIDQASETEALYTLDSSATPIKRYTASVNDFTEQTITTSLSHDYRPDLLAENQSISSFVVNNDESSIYAISPTSEYISFNGTTFTDNGLLTQVDNAITLQVNKSKDNRAHFIRFDPLVGFVLNIYNEQSTLVSTIQTFGQQPFGVEISADDKRLLINASGSTQIEIITIE